MRAKTINEDYPIGAKEDPRAPWNEPDDLNGDISVDVNEFGEIAIFYHDDNEEATIDPHDLNVYLSKENNISMEEVEEKEGFDIVNVEELEKGELKLITNLGNFSITLRELEDLL